MKDNLSSSSTPGNRLAGNKSSLDNDMGSKNSLNRSSLDQAGLPVQRQAVSKNNNTGLPDNLKSGIENLSGHSMDDVKVHYNSDKPAQLQAHAYAQGTDIHLASGQEQHLPHEAWHVVQQKQGRVQATTQLKGVSINNNAGLEKEADVMGAKALDTESAVGGKSVQKGRMASSTSPVQRITKDEFDQQVTDQDLFDKSGSFYKDVNNNDIDKGKAWAIIKKHAGKNLKQLNKDQAIDIIHHLHRDQVSRDKKGKMHQNTHDMDQLYDRAELVHQHFEKEIKKLGKRYGAIEAKVPEGLKKRPRATKKVGMKYKGDASRLNDLVRATMIFKSYKDMKDSGGHALYDILRFFDEDQNATKFTPPTPQKQQKMLQQMTKIKKHITRNAYLSVNKGYQRVVKSVIKDLRNGDGTITINNRKDIDLLREISYAWYKKADDKMSASGQMIVRGGSLIERSTTYEH
ncbi:DUF4157 domain-containing protein [Fulvivirga ulvae]|uniref:eCIS core domain-containing protein n=1 Tax=Fulvivirga ulvae TaxID=2904245 RepID=UPI001F33B165|nr:DUF4157 domain-containing protein [Fulvivirga ulvae]UII33646.1 DUF4157 domain-containing protein [Fulvivirga ulvae]